jgi:hypothetical protein
VPWCELHCPCAQRNSGLNIVSLTLQHRPCHLWGGRLASLSLAVRRDAMPSVLLQSKPSHKGKERGSPRGTGKGPEV